MDEYHFRHESIYIQRESLAALRRIATALEKANRSSDVKVVVSQRNPCPLYQGGLTGASTCTNCGEMRVLHTTSATP